MSSEDNDSGYTLEELLEQGKITSEQYAKMKAMEKIKESKITIEPKDDETKISKERLDELESREARYIALAEEAFQKKAREAEEKLGLPEDSIQTVDELSSAEMQIKIREAQRGEPKGLATRNPRLDEHGFPTGNLLDSPQDWMDYASKLAQSRNPKEKAKGMRMIDQMLKSAFSNRSLRGSKLREVMHGMYLCSCGTPVVKGRVCPNCGRKME